MQLLGKINPRLNTLLNFLDLNISAVIFQSKFIVTI